MDGLSSNGYLHNVVLHKIRSVFAVAAGHPEIVLGDLCSAVLSDER